MPTQKEMLDRVSGQITAHEFGTQTANELIMRALLQAIQQLAGDNGSALVTRIDNAIEQAIAGMKLDTDEQTAMLQHSARMVTESVFTASRRP